MVDKGEMYMAVFFHILGHNIVPIFTIIGLGFMISRKFDLHILTLSKLNLYLFSPVFIFVNLYTTDLDFDMLKVLFLGILYLATNDLLARVIAKIQGYDIGMTNAFKNSIMFNNSGNIGLSLIALVFSSAPFVIDGQTPYLDEALAAQIMILVLTNISSNTLGLYNASRGKMNFRNSIRKILGMPPIYTIPLALLFKYGQFDITTTPIWPGLIYLKGGLVPMSLITLGVQLSKTKFSFGDKDVHISVFTRLIIGPILALIFINLFGFTGVIAQTVFIAHSVPTAVNTALIAVECDNHQSFATKTVMESTIFGAVTLTLAIYGAGVLFPA